MSNTRTPDVPLSRALKALSNGFAIRRRSWPTGKYLTRDGFNRVVIVAGEKSNGTPDLWSGPNPDEIAARDWEVFTHTPLKRPEPKHEPSEAELLLRALRLNRT